VKINNQPPAATTTTTAAEEAKTTAPVTEVQTTAPAKAVDGVDASVAGSTAGAVAGAPPPGGPEGGNSIDLVADLQNHQLFGAPSADVVVAPAADMTFNINPDHLNLDVGASLKAQLADLPPESVQAQAINRLFEELGAVYLSTPVG
jgi:hypothetical protein